jgi:hypothetical protein
MDTLRPVKIGTPTLLPAVISEDRVLSIEQSPYLVDDALLIKPGVKLTINAGTVIWFRSLGMIVKGELQISGTRDDPVRLSSLGPTSWKGIILDNSLTENKINYCTVSNAEFGFRASQSNISIHNSQFQDNGWGIAMEDCRAEIIASLIRTSKKSGIAVHRTRLLIRNSVITENSTGGILLENSRVRIERNNIVNNREWEIKVLDENGQVEAAQNWWGNETPTRTKIVGLVDFQPALKAPIEFEVWDN